VNISEQDFLSFKIIYFPLTILHPFAEGVTLGMVGMIPDLNIVGNAFQRRIMNTGAYLACPHPRHDLAVAPFFGAFKIRVAQGRRSADGYCHRMAFSIHIVRTVQHTALFDHWHFHRHVISPY
jgi:hypothetical protein